MSVLAAITAFLQAATAALKAFPLWLAWRITAECESLNAQIIDHEARNTPADRRRADELRLALTYRSRLHDSLLPTILASQCRDSSANVTRAIPVPD